MASLQVRAVADRRVGHPRWRCRRRHAAAPALLLVQHVLGHPDGNASVRTVGQPSAAVRAGLWKHLHRLIWRGDADRGPDRGAARPSTGFVHGILRRCAHALGEVMTLVKTLVTRAAGRAAIPRGMARYSSGSAR